MFKIKTLLFGCCTSDGGTNPTSSEIDQHIQITQPEEKRKKTYRTDDATTETQNNFLTTEDGQDDINSKPSTLKLTVVESDVLSVGKEFLITSRGLLLGSRRKTDGCTYIGRIKLAKESNIVLNDIVLEDGSVGDRHCMIKYDHDSMHYYIKDQGDGSGTFVRVDGNFKLRSGYIISFGDSHMIVQLQKEKEGTLITQSDDLRDEEVEEEKEARKEGNLTVKFLDGPKSGQMMKFNPEDKIIKIGRVDDCKIKFEGNNMSRHQCSIRYIDEMWYISDGFDKPSTNGTWLFLDHPYVITSGNVIKIGQTLLRAEMK